MIEFADLRHSLTVLWSNTKNQDAKVMFMVVTFKSGRILRLGPFKSVKWCLEATKDYLKNASSIRFEIKPDERATITLCKPEDR